MSEPKTTMQIVISHIAYFVLIGLIVFLSSIIFQITANDKERLKVIAEIYNNYNVNKEKKTMSDCLVEAAISKLKEQPQRR